jgi:hypothetical protein
MAEVAAPVGRSLHATATLLVRARAALRRGAAPRRERLRFRPEARLDRR